MRNMRALACLLALLVLSPFAAAAANPGVNMSIDVEGTPIQSISTPDVSRDGVDFTIEVVLTNTAAQNGTNVTWTVQICINSGVCYPPDSIPMQEDAGKWSSTIQPDPTHTYVNYDIVLDYPEGEDETFPEGGFVGGGKIWSDCWVSGEETGGDNCLNDDGGLLPAPALLTTLVLLSFAAVVRNTRNE